ncbi:MAG: PTS sugar transporter subunit IIC [Endomicrobiales bacterium]|jgi:mannose/fructose/N-acetylgalactosamine-specific phosphotransferase system component IIC
MEIVYLTLLAAIISIDITAYGQFMVSRPIFCAPMFGWLLGDVQTGLWVGMITEFIWVSIIPMGTSIPADTTSIAILSLVWSLLTFPGQKAAVIAAMVLAIPAGVLFRKLDVGSRQFNVRVAHWVEEGVRSGKNRRLRYSICLGVALFFIKALVFYAVLTFAGVAVMKVVFPLLPNTVIAGFTMAWRLLPVAGFGMFLVNFWFGKVLGINK